MCKYNRAQGFSSDVVHKLLPLALVCGLLEDDKLAFLFAVSSIGKGEQLARPTSIGTSAEQPLTKSISSSGTILVFFVNLYANKMMKKTGMGKYVVMKVDTSNPPTVNEWSARLLTSPRLIRGIVAGNCFPMGQDSLKALKPLNMRTTKQTNKP